MSVPDRRDPAVLAWVNELRARYAIGGPLDELPDGEAASGYTCPIARALGVTGTIVDNTAVRYVGKDVAMTVDGNMPLPTNVQLWIARYDEVWKEVDTG